MFRLNVLCLTVSMPRTPRGYNRPADVIGHAVHVMRVATDEIAETETDVERNPAAELGRKGGLARAKALSQSKRRAIAKKAAQTRWKK